MSLNCITASMVEIDLNKIQNARSRQIVVRVPNDLYGSLQAFGTAKSYDGFRKGEMSPSEVVRAALTMYLSWGFAAEQGARWQPLQGEPTASLLAVVRRNAARR